MNEKNRRQRKGLRILIAVLCAVMVSLMIPTGIGMRTGLVTTAQAAVKLNRTKITLAVGMTAQLKVKGTSKKVKWSSTNKKIVSVNSKGKITALKKGTATVRAKVGKKTYKCKVTVKRNYIKFSGQVARQTGFYDVSQNGELLSSINIMPLEMEYLSDGALRVKYMLWNFSETINWNRIAVLKDVYIKASDGNVLVDMDTFKLSNPFSMAPDDTVYLTLTFRGKSVRKVVDLNKVNQINYRIDIYSGSLG